MSLLISTTAERLADGSLGEFTFAMVAHSEKGGNTMEKMKNKVEKHWHKAFVGGHASYFSMVAFEGHGFYTFVAGILALMVVVGAFFHLEDK